MHKLVHQARLAHARLANHRHYLAMPYPHLLLSVAEGLDLRLPPYKAGQPRAALACKQRRTVLAPIGSKTSTGSLSPLTGNLPRAVTCTGPSTRRGVLAIRRMLPGVASCSMRAARCVVCPMTE